MRTHPAMTGKVTMVTGANTGIGKVVARELARRGATVVMVARDPDRGEAARREIAAATGNTSVELLVADLADQSAVRRVADEFHRRHDRLHVLVNNAGGPRKQRQLTADGVELNLALNHLSPFLLTNLVLDTMTASAPARVVNVASYNVPDAVDLDDLQSERDYEPWRAYGQSKLAMTMLSFALARRLAGTGVTVNAMSPGAVATGVADGMWPGYLRPLTSLLRVVLPKLPLTLKALRTPERAAQDVLHLATSPQVAEVTGRYFDKDTEARSKPSAEDERAQERLWEASATLVGLDGLAPRDPRPEQRAGA